METDTQTVNMRTTTTTTTQPRSTEVKSELKLGSNLAGRLAVVELFGQEFDPLQHGGLETQQTHTSEETHKQTHTPLSTNTRSEQ